MPPPALAAAPADGPPPASAAVRLLALDTSTDRLVIAACGPGGVAGLDEEGGARASQRVLPAVIEVLAAAGLARTDVDAVAFARGPGAFTGLRTACSVAQGLALGLGRPALPLDSLLIVADDAAAQQPGLGVDAPCWVAMDARMGEVYAAAYRRDATGWQVVVAPFLGTPDDVLAAHAGAPGPVAGNAAVLQADAPAWARLRERPVAWVPAVADRAAALLRLARAAWHAGAAVDAAQALPLYLRDRVALTTAERAARAAAR